MAELECGLCGQRYYGTVCPRCEGKGVSNIKPLPNTQKGAFQTWVFVIGTVGMLIFMLYAGYKSETQPKPKKPEITQAQRDLIDEMQRVGAIRFDRERLRLYVNPVYWAGFDARTKELLALAASMYLDNSHDIYDMQSGKQLATYRTWSGLEVH